MVLKISNPVAGTLIRSRSSIVILGVKNPLVSDFKSTIAEGSVATIPSPNWALINVVWSTKKNTKNCFFIFIL